MVSAIQKFKNLIELEKLQPPRPGLVPQSGDWNAPDRWIRPEELEASEKVLPKKEIQTVDFIHDTRNDLVGKYITSGSWRDRDKKPEAILEHAGFRYVGTKDLRSEEERQKDFHPSQDKLVQIYQHPQLGRLEIYSEPEKTVTINEQAVWQKVQTVVNPKSDFKPDLRNPETLSLQDRIHSR
ncbi:MAG: hypothetical protein AABX79_00030 [Nanoarchaeota archaeon]